MILDGGSNPPGSTNSKEEDALGRLFLVTDP